MLPAGLVVYAALAFAAYLQQVYPVLPQCFGFGKPSDVRLILDGRAAPPVLLETKADPAAPVISRRVRLLYRTSQEYLVLCDQCGQDAISVSSNVVVGVIWEKWGTRRSRPQWESRSCSPASLSHEFQGR